MYVSRLPIVVLYYSGSEDACGYLWDRHYGNILAKLDHETGVINGVAFGPTQEYLVTVGDDYAIKIWCSKNIFKKWNICNTDYYKDNIKYRQVTI